MDVLCLLIDCSLHAFKHLLIDPSFPLQLGNHLTRSIRTDDLLSNCLKKLARDPGNVESNFSRNCATCFLLNE